MITGTNPEDLFRRAAQAITEIMFRINRIKGAESLEVSLDGEDLADLMVRWLGEILYLFDGEQKIVSDISLLKVSRTHLEAVLNVAVFDPDHHEILTEIKAVTYHQIEVSQGPDGWSARVIFDL
jgi:SHS2 domain-containing protein